MNLSLLFFSVLLVQIWPRANSFAAWMTKDFCDRQLDEGEIIMNEAAIMTNERSIRVFREDKEVSTGSVYVPNEILTVQISDSTGQFVLEAHHAEFANGGCKKKSRVVKNHASLKMPESGSINVTLKAGWSMGHQQVHLTPVFLLKAAKTKKSSIPGIHSLAEHHRAIGSATLDALSHKVSGIFGGKVKHSKQHHDKSVKDKNDKLEAQAMSAKEAKHHGAIDHDKEIHSRKKSKKHRGDTDVHADFETKEESDKDRANDSQSKPKKSKKAHWRHAAKIIESKLRGNAVEGEDSSSIWLLVPVVIGSAVVLFLYSVIRANRFKIGKMMSKDTGFKE